jgi:putative ABC transport system permease protein
MTAARHKILRDLSEEGTRTVLVVFACAAGIAGFLAVLACYAVLTREMNRSYLATRPASATLRLDSIDTGLMTAVRADPAIDAAEARRIVTGQIRGRAGEWQELRLFVIPDFGSIRIGKLEPETGAWPPARGEILIERDALGMARARIGDTLSVMTAVGGDRKLRMAGSLHDVGQPQARMENTVYGYITLNTLDGLGEEHYLDRLMIVVKTRPLDGIHIRDVAAEVAAIARSRGHQVRGMEIPTPGEHPHAQIMGLLFRAISGFGFCILVLSGVLVANLVTGMMGAQGRQIGVMKAVGATSGQVARIYLSQSFLLGTAAILIALPVGLWGSRQLCRELAAFLNIDIASFAPPVWVYLLAGAAGLAVPLIAAALPVWMASGAPVRAALAGVQDGSRAFGSTLADQLLSRAHMGSRPFLLAFRNTFRHASRLALTLAVLVAGGTFFLTALNIRSSMIHTLQGQFTGRQRFVFDQHMVMIYVFLIIVSAIIGVIGGLGLMTAMSLNVLERRREMGVLRAMGASAGAVWLIVAAEGMVAALLGWVMAALLSWPLTRLLGDVLWKRVFSRGLDFRFELSGLLIWLGVSLLLGIAASFLPAWDASRSTIREALSHE